MSWLDKTLNSQPVLFGLAGLAFLIALWLIIVIVRMLTGGKLRFNGGRTRQARLGIVDAFDLDRQRQLIIVRRDNIEHLIMIGGPNDLVIESEIVRVEARDNRRVADKAEGFAENRIPAPFMVPDGAAPSPDEPLLPMPLEPALAPGAALSPADAEALPPRTPTFPLPPRRAPPPQPDRRPPPPPQAATRMDDPPLVPQPVPPPALAPEPSPAATFPPPPSIPPEPLPPIVPTQGVEAPPRPVRPPPPSFLKPLPPRPPIRPLRRATPVAPGATGPQGSEAPVPEAVVPPPPPAPAPVPAAEPVAPPPPPPAPEAVAPHPAPEPPAPAPAPVPEPKPTQPDALESLEEEMAKLLGRG